MSRREMDHGSDAAHALGCGGAFASEAAFSRAARHPCSDTVQPSRAAATRA